MGNLIKNKIDGEDPLVLFNEAKGMISFLKSIDPIEAIKLDQRLSMVNWKAYGIAE